MEFDELSGYAQYRQRTNTLAILKYMVENTNSSLGVGASELAEILSSDDLGWGAPVLTEKTVRECLRDLRALGDSLPFGVRIQQFSDLGEDAEIPAGERRTNWFASPIISLAQMRMLADSLQLSHFHPDDVTDLRSLLASFAGVGSDWLENGQILQPGMPLFRGVPETIERLSRAISAGTKIRFRYGHVALKPRYSPLEAQRLGRRYRIPRVDIETGDKVYEYYPYSTVFKRGDYFLLAGEDPQVSSGTWIRHFVIDRMIDIEILDDGDGNAKQSDFDFVRYINERPYLYSGQAIDVIYRVKGGLDGTYAWFPHARAKLVNDADKEYEVEVRAEPNSMVWWSLQYAESVEILSPQSLRRAIKERLEEALKKYENSDNKRNNTDKYS
ncbi:WYL domain-containing protein [Arcanobacterium hippocoleae]